VVDPKTQISSHLEEKDYDAAFELTLNLRDLTLLNWTIVQLVPENIFPVDKPLLTQRHILSLIQQLGFELNSNTDTKFDWLQYCIDALDPEDETISDYSKGILSQLLQNLTSQPFEPQLNRTQRRLCHLVTRKMN